jgi:parallel beta-helix repeat protein
MPQPHRCTAICPLGHTGGCQDNRQGSQYPGQDGHAQARTSGHALGTYSEAGCYTPADQASHGGNLERPAPGPGGCKPRHPPAEAPEDPESYTCSADAYPTCSSPTCTSIKAISSRGTQARRLDSHRASPGAHPAGPRPRPARSAGGDPTLRRNQIHDTKQNGVFVHDDGRGTLEGNDITRNAKAGVEIKTGGDPTLRRNKSTLTTIKRTETWLSSRSTSMVTTPPHR